MKKRFSEEQIIGFLGEEEAGLSTKGHVAGTVSQKPATIHGAASLAACACPMLGDFKNLKPKNRASHHQDNVQVHSVGQFA